MKHSDFIGILVGFVAVAVLVFMVLNTVSENHERIIVEDVSDNYLKDTQGRVWHVFSMDPFERDDLSPGQALNITWRGWNRDPSYGEWIWVESQETELVENRSTE
jgi:hypothetical protein